MTKWKRITARFLMALTFLSALTVGNWPKSAQDPPDPEWSRTLFRNSDPLSNTPEVSCKSRQGDQVCVEVKNVGDTTLQYFAAGRAHVQLFQEIHDGSKWSRNRWDWCGTGKELFEIAPNQTVELKVRFWDEEAPQRMLAIFSEKDTNRAGLVVLASEETK